MARLPLRRFQTRERDAAQPTLNQVGPPKWALDEVRDQREVVVLPRQ